MLPSSIQRWIIGLDILPACHVVSFAMQYDRLTDSIHGTCMCGAALATTAGVGRDLTPHRTDGPAGEASGLAMAMYGYDGI